MATTTTKQVDLAKLQTDVALLKQFNEKWLPVVGYEDLYEVSSLGRVKSLDRVVEHSSKGKQLVRGRVMRITTTSKYPRVMLSKNGITKQHSVHRLVAEAYLSNPNNKPAVNHKDGNKNNNVVSNLEWSTYSENIRHSFANGLSKVASGEKSHAAKLSLSDVFDIRCRAAKGEMKKNLAYEFGVSKGNITAIVQGKSWREVAV